MKKVLILEDNQVTLTHIASLMQELDIKTDVFECLNVKDAYQIALEKDIDLFIVDIILDTNKPGDASGLKFVDSIRKVERYILTPVIFVTSLEDAKFYTYEKLHCYSFVEKPFAPDKLRELAAQCLISAGEERKKKTLYFRKDGVILAIDREDIVYAECVHHILNIHSKRGDVLSVPYVTLKKLLADVDSDDFVQCSRSTIVNKSFVHIVDITNRVIQLTEQMGTIEIGMMYQKQMRDSFR